MRKLGDPCVLEDRLCIECGDCDRCELNAEKMCDNCCQCIDTEAEYRGIEIDEILINTEDAKETQSDRKSFHVKSKR